MYEKLIQVAVILITLAVESMISRKKGGTT